MHTEQKKKHLDAKSYWLTWTFRRPDVRTHLDTQHRLKLCHIWSSVYFKVCIESGRSYFWMSRDFWGNSPVHFLCRRVGALTVGALHGLDVHEKCPDWIITAEDERVVFDWKSKELYMKLYRDINYISHEQRGSVQCPRNELLHIFYYTFLDEHRNDFFPVELSLHIHPQLPVIMTSLSLKQRVIKLHTWTTD